MKRPLMHLHVHVACMLIHAVTIHLFGFTRVDDTSKARLASARLYGENRTTDTSCQALTPFDLTPLNSCAR